EGRPGLEAGGGDPGRGGTGDPGCRRAAVRGSGHMEDANLNTTTPNLELAVEKVSKTRVKVTVRAGGEPMFVDTLNVSNAAARDKFVTAVTAKFPGIHPERLTTELLQVAALRTSPPPVEPAQPQEVDIRRVVRPELFHTAEVSGITVLVVLDVGGKLVPRWRTYLRWADGRREVIDRPERVTLPDGGTLYVHPDPGEPPWSEPSGWSARSRQDWLARGSAPEP